LWGLCHPDWLTSDRRFRLLDGLAVAAIIPADLLDVRRVLRPFVRFQDNSGGFRSGSGLQEC
jgi:hypothetical protein